MQKNKRRWLNNLTFLFDVLVIISSYITAFFIRFDGLPPQKYLNTCLMMLPLVIVVKTACFYYFKLHRNMWRYAGMEDLVGIIKAVSTGSIIIMAVSMAFHFRHPRSILIIDWLLLIISFSIMKFFIRFIRSLKNKQLNNMKRLKKILIVGAGDCGEMIIREIIYSHTLRYEVAGFIDDNSRKKKKYIHGIPVVGTRTDIPEIVRKKNVEEIIIAIPTLKGTEMRDIVNYCIESGAKYRTVPHISNLVDGTVKVKEFREVKLEDLLKRDEVILDKQSISNYITGKTVLVTGAGGSIGSEICRQVASFSPEKIILFEKSENPLFYINEELERSFGNLNKALVIGDICDRKRVKQVFSRYKPHIIFHAAAHKHVPLMEMNFMEAIKNNVLGTKVVSEEAVYYGAERFIMLSTDKAVEPTSIMGVSKKLAEMFVSKIAKINGTKAITVRFGNVMGSNGSVISVFRKQIKSGGPVTVTHPDIMRYFMTIPEAVGLVLEAGSRGNGGEIFILEMGEQIKIIDLAKDMIRLSGKEPYRDVEIKFTGLRPGENIYEELVAADETLLKTDHEKITLIEQSNQNHVNIFEQVNIMENLIKKENMISLLKQIQIVVPTYNPRTEILRGILHQHYMEKKNKEINKIHTFISKK